MNHLTWSRDFESYPVGVTNIQPQLDFSYQKTEKPLQLHPNLPCIVDVENGIASKRISVGYLLNASDPSLPSFHIFKEELPVTLDHQSLDDPGLPPLLSDSEDEDIPPMPVLPPKIENMLNFPVKKENWCEHSLLTLAPSLISRNPIVKTRPQGRPHSSELCAFFYIYSSALELVTSLSKTSLSELENDGTYRDIFSGLFFQGTGKYVALKSYNSNIHDTLKTRLNCDDFTFAKVTRGSDGRVLQIRTLDRIKPRELTVEFIKKNIIYPRYKAGMKIHLIRGKVDKKVWYFQSKEELHEIQSCGLLGENFRIWLNSENMA